MQEFMDLSKKLADVRVLKLLTVIANAFLSKPLAKKVVKFLADV